MELPDMTSPKEKKGTQAYRRVEVGVWSSSTRVLWQPLIEDNENREEVDKTTNKMRGAHKALDENAGCGQNSRQKCGLRTKKVGETRECGLRTKQSIMVQPPSIISIERRTPKKQSIL